MSKQPKVAVLMSAYNGQRYIADQIESILSQTYQNIVLYVRDDGSTDQTVSILEDYVRDGRLTLIRGENLGFIGSFFQLLKECQDADYYAWCDQDDIWMEKKIERAVGILEKNRNIHRPVLYFSDYDYYDERMRFEKHGLSHGRGPSFANSLMDCISLGINSVFNHRAREMMLEHCPRHCCGHDWWTYMVCAAFGKVIYDKGYCSVKYRRLEKSVSPGGKNFLALQIWRFKKFFVNDYFRKIREQLWEFSDIYLLELKDQDAALLRLFAYRRYSFRRAMKKALYPVWFRQGIPEELMVRGLFLMGML